MSFFRGPKNSEPPPQAATGLPVELLDITKRYDIYCRAATEYRIYENVRFVSIRTLEPSKHQFATALIGGYLEIEDPNGSKLMIPHIHIDIICEYGTHPAYKLLPRQKATSEG